MAVVAPPEAFGLLWFFSTALKIDVKKRNER